MNEHQYELGPIRPPSEARSLLIRVTRNCPWNRCKFCHIYKGTKFELRTVEEIKQDIITVKTVYDRMKDVSRQSGYGESLREVAAMVLNNPADAIFHNIALWLYSGGEQAFLQDANTLIMKTPDLVEVIRFLKESLPTITRITSYARSKTAAKKTGDELKQLYQAGLSRLHIGLESGYDPLLQYMDKGVTAAEHIKGGRNVVASGISLSEYVVLGLGGEKLWREHATETARVLNEINPDFIRVRTLTVNGQMPLYDEIKNGNFVRASDEEIIAEERLLLENLECHAYFASDHSTNLLMEIEGQLPGDKPRLLAVIDRFQALSAEDRENVRVGLRGGAYSRLDDFYNRSQREEVDRMVARLRQDGDGIREEQIYTLMERFI